jgi:hypothetical protein
LHIAYTRAVGASTTFASARRAAALDAPDPVGMTAYPITEPVFG